MIFGTMSTVKLKSSQKRKKINKIIRSQFHSLCRFNKRGLSTTAWREGHRLIRIKGSCEGRTPSESPNIQPPDPDLHHRESVQSNTGIPPPQKKIKTTVNLCHLKGAFYNLTSQRPLISGPSPEEVRRQPAGSSGVEVPEVQGTLKGGRCLIRRTGVSGPRTLNQGSDKV